MLQPLQKEVLDTIDTHFEEMNEVQRNAYQKKLEKEKGKPKEKQKEVTLN